MVYGREILRGIARYLSGRPRWSIFLDERELGAPPPDWLLDWRGHGVICRSTTAELARRLTERRIAAVDLNDRYGDLGLPRVSSDMVAIGRLAARTLLSRGYGRIAFCGFADEAWSEARLAGVAEAVEPCSVFRSPWRGLREHAWEEEGELLARWLTALPRPVGVVACNDVRGYHVLDACRSLGLAVPEEIAVIGVDNADTFCALCDPPLSSVVPDAERLGFEAAALLEQLMDGVDPPARSILIPPKGVAARESTDSEAIHDPMVLAAARFIRRRAHQAIAVGDVAAHVKVSRSTLERRFRLALSRSPHEEIVRARLKRVMARLAETDWPLNRIADDAGFDHPEYMMVQFKRETGLTPTEWRMTKNLSART